MFSTMGFQLHDRLGRTPLMCMNYVPAIVIYEVAETWSIDNSETQTDAVLLDIYDYIE